MRCLIGPLTEMDETMLARMVRARRIIRRLMKPRPSAKPILDRLNMEIRALRKVAK